MFKLGNKFVDLRDIRSIEFVDDTHLVIHFSNAIDAVEGSREEVNKVRACMMALAEVYPEFLMSSWAGWMEHYKLRMSQRESSTDAA